MITVTAKGQGDLAKIGRRIEAAGNTGLRRELTKQLKVATEPAKEKIREAAIDMLPHEGGLNEIVANAKFSTRTTIKGSNPSVRLSLRSKGHDLKAVDRGQLRHPVFADSNKTRREWRWVSQNITPGFWTKTLERHGKRTRINVLYAIREVSRMVTRG